MSRYFFEYFGKDEAARGLASGMTQDQAGFFIRVKSGDLAEIPRIVCQAREQHDFGGVLRRDMIDGDLPDLTAMSPRAGRRGGHDVFDHAIGQVGQQMQIRRADERGL
jgi:hypothetical protein